MKKQTEKDEYFVAVKIFLEDNQGRLFIFKDRFGDWDLPGGRLRQNDFNVSLNQVVRRKIKEELGSVVRYRLKSQPILFMRHERNEILADGTREKRRIFALGYQAKYVGGKIKLGKHHLKNEWVMPRKFSPEKYFIGGWLKGVKDYVHLIKK